MSLPKKLSRTQPGVYKNVFGHLLLLAGSRNMTGAAALSSLAAIRSGAGLVTLGIPKSLNAIIHKKISPVIMTLPLNETKNKSLSVSAYTQIQKRILSFQVLAMGPGLSCQESTQGLIRKIVSCLNKPMVIDADALNAISQDIKILNKNQNIKILTPHPGEMARLTGLSQNTIETNRKQVACDFAQKFRCTLVLKGHRTVVTSADGKSYTNTTGNAGMATAGSGDVLTGMIAAFLAQGLSAFEAARYGVFIHGLAGDLAAKSKTKLSMIATDIIDYIPNAIKKIEKSK